MSAQVCVQELDASIDEPWLSDFSGNAAAAQKGGREGGWEAPGGERERERESTEGAGR